MSRNRSLGLLLLKKLEELKKEHSSPQDELKGLYKILAFTFDEITRKDNILLSTLFTKIAFVGNKYKLNRAVLFTLHTIRKCAESDTTSPLEDWAVQSKRFQDALEICIADLFEVNIESSVRKSFSEASSDLKRKKAEKYIPSETVFVDKIDSEAKKIKGIIKDSPFVEVHIRYDVLQVNDLFTANIERIKELGALPIEMQLHRIEVIEGDYVPSVIVIEPSFLIDVTSISKCFKSHGTEPTLSLLGKFIRSSTSASMLVGNIANFLLDEIITNPSIEFKEIISKLFQLDPLNFALFDNRVVKEIIDKVELHFTNLKRVVQMEFVANGVLKEDIYLEPAFFSPSYGLQGRLDLLNHNVKEGVASIVELKSGKPFKPNAYGLNNEHYAQTLLYDLLIRSTYGSRTRINSFILYSVLDKDNLRLAPKVAAQQLESVKVRNEVILDQLELESLNIDSDHILSSLSTKSFQKIYGFDKQNVHLFMTTYGQLDEIEKKYFDLFTRFVAREHRLSKVGTNEIDRLNGLASIWRNDLEEKKEHFNVLNHLEIKKNKTSEEVPVIIFQRSFETAVLSNFRVGDITIIYPDLKTRLAATKSQVFKGTILRISDNEVEVRLRSKQSNYGLFRSHKYWHIEHDVLDSGYNAMYRSLFEFAASPKQNRDLWLTRTAPKRTETPSLSLPSDLTVEQAEIFEEILSAEDYYLLWGPPGTGKTSFMVKYIIEYLHNNTGEHLLLMAYTNRAVDEICEAICNINATLGKDFIRIGSRYSTHQKYQANLLDNRTAFISSRSSLVELIQETRVFVGTVSSVMGKQALFQMKHFDRVVIDEASQLLEPNLVGLLSRFKKVVLIGDHLQLPAVVQQKNVRTKITDEALTALGLRDCGNSLFERLYKRCESQNWYWAIGQLSIQGRMHEELMHFPNEHIYGGVLSTLEKLERLRSTREWNGARPLETRIADHRRLYVETPIDELDTGLKTNVYEAKTIVHLLDALMPLLQNNGVTLNEKSIGIITPYRAQIAKIKSMLEALPMDTSEISVDTVERYQGGARDIIIISFCMNHRSQMRSLVNLSEDGIDRKLNVALTRAKEQIILIGNRAVLSSNPMYAALLSGYHALEYNFEHDEISLS